MSLPFRAEDVLPRIGYPVGRGDRQDYICPWCGGKAKKLNWSFKKQVYRCNQNEDHHGNILNFYAELYGISTKEAYKELLKLTGTGNTSDRKPVVPTVQQKEVKENPLAPISKRNEVITKWLSLSPLSNRHKEDLLRRGFLPEEIAALNYGSLKSMSYEEKLSFMKKLDFSDYAGVPPFYISKKGYWFLNIPARADGIITPFIDIMGRKRIMQVRRNNELVKENEGKCFYLTSNGMNGGTASCQFVHYACDFRLSKDGRKCIDIKNGVLTLTEGVIKADLYHAITKMPTIAVPGVNCQEALSRELPKLKKLGVHTIVVAFDMDRVMNVEVMKALDKIGHFITESGFECRFKEWGTEYVRFNGTHDFIDTYKEFVITPRSYTKMVERSKTSKRNIVDVTLEKVKEYGRTSLLFAFENSKDARENEALYREAKKKASEFGFEITPVFWKLKLKAIDDLYAYKLRGINP